MNTILTLEVAGATDSELARGLAAAEVVFAERGVTALQAVTACNIVMSHTEAMNHSSFEPTEQQVRDYWIWVEAQEAAIAACCAGWSMRPQGAALVMKCEDGSIY